MKEQEQRESLGLNRRSRKQLAALALTLSVLASPLIGCESIIDFSRKSSSPDNTSTPTQLFAPEPTQIVIETPKPIPQPTKSPEIARNPLVMFETNASSGSEPSISASPYNPDLVAITYQHALHNAGCDLSGVRISTDGGKTFNETQRKPWEGHCPDYHGQIAWGPGKTPDSSRLWWTDAIIVGTHQIAAGITHSDDLGKTWAPMHIERRTPPWIGGFPDISVDNNKESPNFGTVYVAYNWLESSHGPGLSVLASGDRGKSWQIAQVADVGLKNYPDYWRIGYRIKPSPDGSALVSFYESDLKNWNPNDVFNQGPISNIGRLGFATAKIEFDRYNKTLKTEKPKWAITLSKNRLGFTLDPQWQSELSVEESGRTFLAVADSENKGNIHVGFTDNNGNTWDWKQINVKNEFECKPSITARNGVVFLGFHGLDSQDKVSTYYSMSYDDGKTFSIPAPINNKTWNYNNSSSLVNGAGLRESADFGPSAIYYAYGDGRKGAGKVNVFVAKIKP